MPQFFHPRWNALARLSFYGLPVLLLLVCVAGWLVARSPRVTRQNEVVQQPVFFSHAIHSGRLGLDCRYCHTAVETSAFAGMPSTEVCMNCHQHVWTGLPELEPVRSSYTTGIPLAWLRVHNLPDHAMFHHGIHVHMGIGCATCHGRVDRMPQIWQVETLRMSWCLECHRNPERYVRPRSEVFNMAWQNPTAPEEVRALGEKLGLEPTPDNPTELGQGMLLMYGIQKRTSCSSCHQ